MNVNKTKIKSNSTRTIVVVLGIILGVTGIIHGLYEIIQGNKATSGIIIQAIGSEQQNWLYGGEEALTIIPNYLITGIITIFVSLMVIIWTVFFITRKNGSLIFFLLNFLSFLTGGGIFQIVTFTIATVFSTRINGTLDWWENKLSENFRNKIKGYWIPFTILGVLPYLFVQEIGIFGIIPGITDPEIIINMVFILLFISLILFVFAFISGFAYEIENRKLSNY